MVKSSHKPGPDSPNVVESFDAPRGSSEFDYLPADSSPEDIDRYFVVRDAQKLFFDSMQETLDIYWYKKWEKYESIHTMEDDAFQMCRIKLVKHMPRLDELKSKWWTYSTLISRTALIDFRNVMGKRDKFFVSQIHNHRGITSPIHGIVRGSEDDCGDILQHVPEAPSCTSLDNGNERDMELIPSGERSALDNMIRNEELEEIRRAIVELRAIQDSPGLTKLLGIIDGDQSIKASFRPVTIGKIKSLISEKRDGRRARNLAGEGLL